MKIAAISMRDCRGTQSTNCISTTHISSISRDEMPIEMINVTLQPLMLAYKILGAQINFLLPL
jgi:hypothetical protein